MQSACESKRKRRLTNAFYEWLGNAGVPRLTLVKLVNQCQVIVSGS
jgi:hypothetical protein